MVVSSQGVLTGNSAGATTAASGANFLRSNFSGSLKGPDDLYKWTYSTTASPSVAQDNIYVRYHATCNGSYMNAFQSTGADLAEVYYSHDNTEPGDLLSIDGSLNAGVKKTSSAYESSLLGIVTTKPGYVLSDSEGADPTAQPVQMALTGRVPVKVSNENGAIKTGDALTSSSKPGVAMKATGPGWVIGVAMQDFDAENGKVMTFVNRAWYPGDGSNKTPSLTGLTLTDGELAGTLATQSDQLQTGLTTNDPILVGQAINVLKDVQNLRDIRFFCS
jgi:hypothetical protein